MTIDRIEVFCDDPRHAYPDEPLVTFVLVSGYWWEFEDWEQAGSPAQDPMEHHRRRGAGQPVYRFECWACPAKRPGQIECTGTTLQWLLSTVAGLGMAQSTLRVLNLILSQPKQT